MSVEHSRGGRIASTAFVVPVVVLPPLSHWRLLSIGYRLCASPAMRFVRHAPSLMAVRRLVKRLETDATLARNVKRLRAVLLVLLKT